jgi:hypothetical protein
MGNAAEFLPTRSFMPTLQAHMIQPCRGAVHCTLVLGVPTLNTEENLASLFGALSNRTTPLDRVVSSPRRLQKSQMLLTLVGINDV